MWSFLGWSLKPLEALDQTEVFVCNKALDPSWFWFCLLLANVWGSKGDALKAALGESIKSEHIFDIKKLFQSRGLME